MILSAKINPTFYLINILSFLIIGWMNSGILRLLPHFNAYIVLILFICWFGLALTSYKNLIGKMLIEIKWLVILVFLCLPSSILIYGGIEESFFMTFLFIIILYTMYIYYRERVDKFTTFIFVFLLVDKIIIAFYTIIMNDKYPNISRALAAGISAVEGYSVNAVLLGGYSFVYGSVFLVIYFIAETKHFSELRYKILSIFYLVITIFMLIKASYTMAFLSVTGFIIAYFLVKKWGYVVTVVCMFLIITFYKDVVSLLYAVANWSFLQGVLSEKITIFADFLVGDSVQGSSLSQRGYLYSQSIEIVKSNLLLGIYDEPGAKNQIGNHSEWFDSLAMFGIIRFCFLVAFIISAFKNVYNLSNFKKGLILGGIYIIFIGFFNPILYYRVFLELLITIPFANKLMKVRT